MLAVTEFGASATLGDGNVKKSKFNISLLSVKTSVRPGFFSLQSGYGGISVVLEGPHRSELDYEELEPGKYKIMYSPHEPGIYILNVRFTDEHVNGMLVFLF